MKITIIYASMYYGNTEKIAKEIGSILEADIFKLFEIDKKEIEMPDVVGFGSGIYLTNFHKGLLDLVSSLPIMKGKKVFFFSTSGMKGNNIFNRSHDKFRKILEEKKFEIIGDFNCLGYDNYSILKIIGGINKGRPNEKDLENVKEFAQMIKNNVNK